jgi:IclR family acetate operon transcriptional repressor
MRTVGAPDDHAVRRVTHTVGVLDKAIDVLEAIVWGEPRTTRELSEDTGIEKAAVYRIVNTLAERGFVAKDDTSKRYYPGPRLVAAAGVLARTDDIVTLATPYMEQLRDTFGETVNLAVLVGADVQYLEIIESRHSLRMAATIGSRDPANATALGKAILSQLDDDVVRQTLGETKLRTATPRTIADWEQLQRDLEAVRHRGYALDTEENEVGATCVAVPVTRPGGSSLYAISVSGPSARMRPRLVSSVGKRLREVAAALSGAGGRAATP